MFTRNAEVSTEELESAIAELDKAVGIVGDEAFESLGDAHASVNRAINAVDEGATFEDKIDDAMPFTTAAVDQLELFFEELDREWKAGNLRASNANVLTVVLLRAKAVGLIDAWRSYATGEKRKLEDGD